MDVITTRSVGMNLARPFKAGFGGRPKSFPSRSDGLKILNIVFIASLTRRGSVKVDVIPALKGWATFIATLRVAGFSTFEALMYFLRLFKSLRPRFRESFVRV
jgi:hypothetical protein